MNHELLKEMGGEDNKVKSFLCGCKHEEQALQDFVRILTWNMKTLDTKKQNFLSIPTILFWCISLCYNIM